MSSQIARMKAEEEANAMILGMQNNPTLAENTGSVEETTPKQAPQAERIPNTSGSEQTWEAKYKVLQGKYNAEVPKLRDEIQTLKQQTQQPATDVSQYTKQISDLQTKVNTLESQKPNSLEDGKDLDGYLESEYGSEFANAIKNMIKQHSGSQGASSSDVTELKSQFDNIQRDNQQSQQDLKVQTLTETLKSQGIDFKQVDTDPMFVEWLAQEEGQTGHPRNEFLGQSFAKGDINRTATYYSAFKAQERSSFDKNPLANHVDVSGNHSVPDSGSEEDIWTGDDVKRLYEDHRKGDITQETFDKYEQSLNRAMLAGNLKA
jgi:hypothetical protein